MIYFSENVFYKRTDQGVLLYRIDDYSKRQKLHYDMLWVFDEISQGSDVDLLIDKFNELFPQSPVPLRQTLDYYLAGGWFQTNQPVIRSTIQKSPALTTVNLRLTNRCNLRCSHCFPESNQADPLELDHQTKSDLIDAFSEFKPVHLTLTGGEPMLDKHLIDYIHQANQHGMLVSLCTNALLIDDEMIEQLKTCHFASFKVSLDGINAKAHGAYRGAATFLPTLRKIKALIEAGLPVCINTVISQKNKHQVAQMLPFFSELGVKEFAYDLIRPSGRAKQSWDSFSLSEEEQVDILKYFQRYFPEYRGMVLGSKIMPLLLQDSLSEDELELACGSCVKNVIVLADGTVGPCWRLIDHHQSAGVLSEKTFQEIWQEGDLFYKVRTTKTSSFEQCKQCELNVFCDGHCRGHALHDGLDWLAPPNSARCQLMKKLGGSPFQAI